MGIKEIVKKQFGNLINMDRGSSVFRVDFHIHTHAFSDYEFQDKAYNDAEYPVIILDKKLL